MRPPSNGRLLESALSTVLVVPDSATIEKSNNVIIRAAWSRRPHGNNSHTGARRRGPSTDRARERRVSASLSLPLGALGASQLRASSPLARSTGRAAQDDIVREWPLLEPRACRAQTADESAVRGRGWKGGRGDEEKAALEGERP